jgi:hypothetical protein
LCQFVVGLNIGRGFKMCPISPVFKNRKDNKYYHWDETGLVEIGPFSDEEEAVTASYKYSVSLDNERVDSSSIYKEKEDKRGL